MGASVVWRHYLDVERVIASIDVVLDAHVWELNRTEFVGGPIPREDGPDGTIQQVRPRSA
jgi:hypothetical protein